MSILDIFKNVDFGSLLDTITSGTRSAASSIRNATPGGMGGLLGAGALGALLGNVMSGSAVRNAAILGAGAVAWNFYKKWAQGKKDEENQRNESQAIGAGAFRAADADPTAQLAIRAMIYAAKADGEIDAEEQRRINAVIQAMIPGKNVSALVTEIEKEPINPAKLAQAVTSPEQADDVYRLSCSVIDIDHFMEVSYTDALAKALGISPEHKKELEEEAIDARKQLMAAIPDALGA